MEINVVASGGLSPLAQRQGSLAAQAPEMAPTADAAPVQEPSPVAVEATRAVEIIERPKPVEVNGVKQYWAKVRVVPVVYFQLDTKSRFDHSALTKQLERRGFTVPKPDRIPGLARGGAGRDGAGARRGFRHLA